VLPISAAAIVDKDRAFFLICRATTAGYRGVLQSMGSLGDRVKVLNHQPRGALGEAAARVSLLLLRSSVGILAALLLLAASQAEARGQRSHGHARHASPGPSFALVSESIVIDVETGRVLSAMNAMRLPIRLRSPK